MSSESRSGRLGLDDGLLLATVVLLPWAFGGGEIWAFRGAGLLLVLAATVAYWRRGGGCWGIESRSLRWLLPAVLMAGWAGCQLIPLPPSVIALLSPAGNEIYAGALPGYDSENLTDPLDALESLALSYVPEVNDPPKGRDYRIVTSLPGAIGRNRPLSLQPDATRDRLFWYLALLVGFLLIRERVSHAEIYRVYRAVFYALFVALAVFGLAQEFYGNGEIFWSRRLFQRTRFFGPYINPNHFAGAMELAIPWLAGYAWEKGRRSLRGVFKSGFLPAAVATLICLTAGLAAASKMAAVLYLLGLMFLFWYCAENARTRWIVLAAGVVVAASGTLLLQATTLGQRFRDLAAKAGSADLLGERMVAWKHSFAMLSDFYLTGAGFGSFREVFTRYMPGGDYRRWLQAHNDYLEVLLDGGVIAGVLLVWLIWGYSSRLIQRTGRFEPSESQSEIGLVVGIACLALHGFVDFNHQMPGNALLFVALSAMALPALRKSSRDVEGMEEGQPA